MVKHRTPAGPCRVRQRTRRTLRVRTRKGFDPATGPWSHRDRGHAGAHGNGRWHVRWESEVGSRDVDEGEWWSVLADLRATDSAGEAEARQRRLRDTVDRDGWTSRTGVRDGPSSSPFVHPAGRHHWGMPPIDPVGDAPRSSSSDARPVRKDDRMLASATRARRGQLGQGGDRAGPGPRAPADFVASTRVCRRWMVASASSPSSACAVPTSTSSP